MFSNLNWYNVVILLLLALFIFGDKLPQMISDGLRMARNLRRMAQNATSDLSRELGTDIKLEDLHPKAFVRKHLLSEADQEKLLQPLKSVSDDVVRQTRGLESEFKTVGREADRVAGEVKSATGAGRRSRSARSATGVRAGSAAPTGQVAPSEPGAPVEAEPPRAGRGQLDDIT
jgi:sec-independent protein translocase protein TatB